jgi:hypothetical protein
MTSKVWPSTALTNLLLINRPVLFRSASARDMGWEVVRLLVRFPVRELDLCTSQLRGKGLVR